MLARRRPVFFLALALALPAFATQKPASPAAPARPTTTKLDPLAVKLCDALHALPAARRKACCGGAATSLSGLCAEAVSASLRSGAIALEAAEVEACAIESSRSLAGCDWVTPLQPPAPAACRDVLRGTLKSGARCRSSLECGDGLACRGVTLAKDGVCAAPTKARTRCEVPTDNLASFTRDPLTRHPVCEGACIKGQCIAVAAEGGACASSALCAAGLNCIGGRCEARPFPKPGESCAGGTSCEAGAVCLAGRCAPLKAQGEPCATPFECKALACTIKPGEPAGVCASACGAPAMSRER